MTTATQPMLSRHNYFVALEAIVNHQLGLPLFCREKTGHVNGARVVFSGYVLRRKPTRFAA